MNKWNWVKRKEKRKQEIVRWGIWILNTWMTSITMCKKVELYPNFWWWNRVWKKGNYGPQTQMSTTSLTKNCQKMQPSLNNKQLWIKKKFMVLISCFQFAPKNQSKLRFIFGDGVLSNFVIFFFWLSIGICNKNCKLNHICTYHNIRTCHHSRHNFRTCQIAI